jgi:hypothetical protein
VWVYMLQYGGGIVAVRDCASSLVPLIHTRILRCLSSMILSVEAELEGEKCGTL